MANKYKVWFPDRDELEADAIDIPGGETVSALALLSGVGSSLGSIEYEEAAQIAVFLRSVLGNDGLPNPTRVTVKKIPPPGPPGEKTFAVHTVVLPVRLVTIEEP